jgi:hypothetical protein
MGNTGGAMGGGGGNQATKMKGTGLMGWTTTAFLFGTIYGRIALLTSTKR